MPDTPPAPVSVADAKAHLRVTHAMEDALIARLISAAIERIEADLGAPITPSVGEAPEGLRQAVLALVADAYAAREAEPPAPLSLRAAEPWLATVRTPRL
ncbi:hypothetical protein BH09PSE2_BH09PSE2_03430 [soil metagenome]